MNPDGVDLFEDIKRAKRWYLNDVAAEETDTQLCPDHAPGFRDNSHNPNKYSKL